MDKNNTDLKQTIRNIITESLNNDRSNYDGTKVFGISRYVEGLMVEAETNPKLMNFLTNYRSRIQRGGKEFMMFEEFGQGLGQFAKGSKAVKEVIESMNNTLAEYGDTLQGFRIIEEQINDEYVRESMRESYNEFLAEPCEETKTNLMEAIQNLYNLNEQAAMNFTLLVTDETSKQPEFFVNKPINESAQAEYERKVEESRKERMANDIFAKVERYLDERQNAEAEKQIHLNERYSLQGIANKNGLKLYEHLKTVLKSNASKNVALKNILLQYSDALANGAYEERLYETLLQNTSKFDYLLPVDKMRKAIMETANEKYEQITLTKLLEMMRDNYNSYIYVDLIQEDVARYVENPTPVNRVQLRNALMPYASDPYINEMFKIIYSDDTLNANTLSEKAISIKEQIDLIKQDTTVSNIYTPVQFIRENESIFNVNGQYYVKKGNSIAALDKKYISKLDERFVELCRLVNDPRVEILENSIILTGTDRYATIYEGYVDIDGYRESAESLRNLNEMCMKYENYDTNFYIMCSCLLENFNNIAKIDWAKHITLNKNNAISADLFKLDENIFMALHDTNMLKHTFYRNVNPLFCKNTLNEHMGINVSSLFSDMLPNQDKIILRLNETKNEYESSIEEYEKMIADLEDAQEDAQTEELKSQIKDTIEDTKQKLEDVKSEYKEWQKNSEEMLQDSDDAEKDDDANEEKDDQIVTKETSSEPLDDEEVDDMRDELSTPLTAGDGQNEGEAEAAAIADEISDDEFSDYLATDATDDTVDPDEDEIIDTDVVDNTVVEPEDDEFGFEDNEIEEEPDVIDDEEFKTVDTEDIPVDDVEAEDDIFDENPEADTDELDDQIPAEDVSDEEDIIFDEPEVEEPQNDMTTIDAETGEEVEPGTEATDIFGANVNDPLGDKAVADNGLFNPGTETNDFNIVNVMFDGNVNDGTVMKSGEVLVLRPMIDATGKKYTDEIKVKFYLNADGVPVISAGTDMTNAMYNAIRDAVTSHPDFNNVAENGIAVSGVETGLEGSDIDAEGGENWETEYNDDATAEDKGIYTIGDDVDGDVLDFGDSEENVAGDDVADVIDTAEIDSTPVSDEPLIHFSDESGVTEEPAEDNDVEDVADEFDFSDIFGDIDDSEIEEPVAEPGEVHAVETPAVEAPVVDPVDTYTDVDRTEIEIPAPEADETEVDVDAEADGITADDLDFDSDSESDEEKVEDDIIPENFSRKVTKQQMNENRKAILSIKKTKK